MSTQNGILSSEDELAASGIQEPVRYEFEAFLSDDEAMPDAPPEATAPHESSQPPSPTLSDMLQASAAVNDDEASVSNDWLPDGSVNGAPESFRDSVTGSVTGRSATGSASVISSRNVRFVDIEVGLKWLPPKKRAAFEVVEVDMDEDELASGNGYHSPRRLRKRQKAAYDDHRSSAQGSYEDDDGRKRKRQHEDDDFLGNDLEDDDLEEYYSADEDELDTGRHRRSSRRGQDNSTSRHTTRASTRASSRFPSTEADAQSSEGGRALRRLRSRSEQHPNPFQARQDEKDELQESDHDKDPDFFFVQSDVLKPKRKRGRKGRGRPSLGRSRGDGEIEFEARRSGRANKNTNTKDMYVSYADDDDEIFYVVEDKTPGPPKILSMREIFQPVSAEFKEVHRNTCDTCGNGEMSNKGPLVPCQGCSIVQHKACLNSRSQRDQRVTKVDVDSFVMQCRFCLCIHSKKDPRAPQQDTCQQCHMKGDSCAPFSEKKTLKQEEILRLENDGVDPITPVDKSLVNNPKNPLFRCCHCRRAWHYEHLPHPNKSRDPVLNDPQNLRKYRIQEYQVDWTCKECRDTEHFEIDRVVAWRPISKDIYTKGQTIENFTEDQIEYLLKWKDKSFRHCDWMPGAWAHGIMKPAMRKSFIKRTLGEIADDEELEREDTKDSLLRWKEEDAIHDAWITPDIILDVHYAPSTQHALSKYKAMSRDDKFEHDLNQVLHITGIFVKFEGLGYEDVVWDTPPDAESPLWDPFLDAYREYLVGKHFKPEPSKLMKERLEKFRTMDFVTEIEVKEQPKALKRGKLMTYQLEGLNWMLHRFRLGENAILADEMGLGKTVQVVALLSSITQDNPKIWPFLIVVPNATCANWRREIKKWAPDLRVVAYYGGRVPQKMALQYELFPNGSTQMKAHVVIMSYDSIKDTETKSKFSGVSWAGLIIDEAQALKNDEATLYKALKNYKPPFKLLLTGTPMQNNNRELFNLLQFLDPSLDATTLDEKYAELTKANVDEIHAMIRPYFLRRTKAGVLTFLPPMTQVILPVSMSILQERLCKSIMSRNPELIRSIFARGKLKKTERGSLNNILMQLRKCLCHPFVYSSAVEDQNLSAEMMRRNLIEASSKLVLLETMLPKLKERGHRVLIFSQFLEQLTILEDFLTCIDMKFARLDGSQSSLEKQKRIDAFNAPDSNIFCMLLSTRAGGVGINLATADTVIIMDPDWNPHQDTQALSRAHRIGQKKKVLCFQLMTVDSAEEKMMQIGQKKMLLKQILIDNMDVKEGEDMGDFEAAFKHGAAALFGDGEKRAAIKYDETAIEKLLDRSLVEEAPAPDTQKAAESSFAFAKVWTLEKGELADRLPDEEDRAIDAGVWESILNEREEEARKEMERHQEILGRGGRRRGATNYTSQRFDFEDGQEGPAADSDHSSVDDEFNMGEGESDGESTDEGRSGSPGEFGNGANSRKQATQEIAEDAHEAPSAVKAPNPLKAPNAVKTSNPRPVKGFETPNPVPRPPVIGSQSNGYQSNGSQSVRSQSQSERGPNGEPIPRKRGRPKGSGKKQLSAGTSREATPGSQDSRKRKSQGNVPNPNFNPQQASGNSEHGQQPVKEGQPGPGPRSIHLAIVVGRDGGAGPRPTPTPVVRGYLNGTASPSPAAQRQVIGTAAAVAVGGPVRSGRAPADPRVIDPNAVVKSQKIQKDPCLVCGFLHPPTWDCPEMGSEINIRLALDKLRTMPNINPEVLTKKKLFLMNKIVELRNRNGQGSWPRMAG